MPEKTIEGNFKVLPAEVTIEVFFYLEDHQLTKIARLSSFFKNTSSEEILWKRLLERQVSKTEAPKWIQQQLISGKSHKQAYRKTTAILQRQLLKKFYAEHPDIKSVPDGKSPSFLAKTEQSNLKKGWVKLKSAVSSKSAKHEKILHACLNEDETQIISYLAEIINNPDKNVVLSYVICSLYNKNKNIFDAIMREFNKDQVSMTELMEAIFFNLKNSDKKLFNDKDIYLLAVNILAYYAATTIQAYIPLPFKIIFDSPNSPTLFELAIAYYPLCVMTPSSNIQVPYILHGLSEKYFFATNKTDILNEFRLFRNVYSIENGFLLELMDKNSITILEYLLLTPSDEIIDCFLDAFDRKTIIAYRTATGENLLQFSLKNSHLKSFRYYFENYPELVTIRYDNNETILHLFVQTSFQDKSFKVVILDIIKKNYSWLTNAQDSSGNTPLHYCANKIDPNTVDLLIIYDANVNVKNNDGENALFFIVSKYLSKVCTGRNATDIEDIQQVISLFIKNKVSIFDKNKNGKSILSYICEYYMRIINLEKARRNGNINAHSSAVIQDIQQIKEMLFAYREKILSNQTDKISDPESDPEAEMESEFRKRLAPR